MKAFLSHSSKDKGLYVETVARQLTNAHCHYDVFTFEGGRKTLDEIIHAMGESDLFVFFISHNSLESEWVKKEIAEAYSLMEGGRLQQLLPLIIDPAITHRDPRIPLWIREHYNLKLVTKPTIAARRIVQQLREISWLKSPLAKEKAEIFVGRNEQIRLFEERFDAIDLPHPIAVIASGIPGIGRRALLKHCFVKASEWRASYSPMVIEMDSAESIEDFIVKVADLGVAGLSRRIADLLTATMQQKLELARELLIDLAKAKESIIVVDRGCLVTPHHGFAAWFMETLNGLPVTATTALCIATRFRPRASLVLHEKRIFLLEVPELNSSERSGLLKRHLDVLGVQLDGDTSRLFANLLNGYPEQAIFAARFIHAEGVPAAKNDTAAIVDFNTERVALLLKPYEAGSSAFELLCLLAEFEFISWDYLLKIADDDERTRDTLKEFLGSAICERIGAAGEYVRLNDMIRDYMHRRGATVPDRFRERMRAELNTLLADESLKDADASVILFSIKEALLNGQHVPDWLLIPSHFLKSMKELYNRQKRYREIVELADRVLANEKSLDIGIVQEIRYYLCLALAREKDKRCLAEVRKITGSDRNFILGFYYRVVGRFKDSLTHFRDALTISPRSPKVRREIVTVYLRLGLYSEALVYARANYEQDQTNPYHLLAYIRCLNHSPRVRDRDETVERLLQKLSTIPGRKVEEMYVQARAERDAFVKRDPEAAIRALEDRGARERGNAFLNLSLLEILESSGRIAECELRLNELFPDAGKENPWYTAILRFRCLILAGKGMKKEAAMLLDSADLPPESKARLSARIASAA